MLHLTFLITLLLSNLSPHYHQSYCLCCVPCVYPSPNALSRTLFFVFFTHKIPRNKLWTVKSFHHLVFWLIRLSSSPCNQKLYFGTLQQTHKVVNMQHTSINRAAVESVHSVRTALMAKVGWYVLNVWGNLWKRVNNWFNTEKLKVMKIFTREVSIYWHDWLLVLFFNYPGASRNTSSFLQI